MNVPLTLWWALSLLFIFIAGSLGTIHYYNIIWYSLFIGGILINIKIIEKIEGEINK